eukprot:gnl/MRDRNA2_/MRDRNA2_253246_c0_seq1.p1 gnl/MRDRNA2_/MRDRNA2_253246_c0~~gnl/MRDRNA2_/MRDRNA2_253246_c0_seq1.p1  ORF type:complete len:197 (-),score=44.53 gnl/MRDRNA2_/MRDRNA2_253246_c0_seq1:47-613(-)
MTGELHVALQACRRPADDGEAACWEDVCAFDLNARASQDISMESLLQRLQMGLQQGIRTGALQSALQATRSHSPEDGEAEAILQAEADAAGASCDQRYSQEELLEDVKRRLSSNLVHGIQNGDLRGALIATRLHGPEHDGQSMLHLQEQLLEDVKRRLSFNLLHGIQNGDLRGALIATRDVRSAASAV